MKIFLVIVLVMVSFSCVWAQSNKNEIRNYNYKITDKYKPATAATLAVIPGVGHFYSGHYFRGILFPAAMAVSGYLVAAGSLSSWASGWSNNGNSGEFEMAFGATSFVLMYLWNFFDAVRVAKISNIEIREKAVSFKMAPFFENNSNERITGVTLNFSF